MVKAAKPPSGTCDFLTDDVRRRRAAFDRVSAVFEHRSAGKFVLIYGADEQAARVVTVRNKEFGQQAPVPFADVADDLRIRLPDRRS